MLPITHQTGLRAPMLFLSIPPHFPCDQLLPPAHYHRLQYRKKRTPIQMSRRRVGDRLPLEMAYMDLDIRPAGRVRTNTKSASCMLPHILLVLLHFEPTSNLEASPGVP